MNDVAPRAFWLLLLGACGAAAAVAGAGDPVTPYSEASQSVIDRWNLGDCNAIWIGDSISALSYIGVQSSLYIGIAQAHPNVVGLQHPVNETLHTSRSAHRMQFATEHEAPGRPIGQPGLGAGQVSRGGAHGLLPVQGYAWIFDEEHEGPELSTFEFRRSAWFIGAGDIANPNWWAGEDVRCDWIYFREDGSNPERVRLRAEPNYRAVSDVTYRLSDPWRAEPDIDAPLATFESTSGDGLCLISQRVNGAEENATGFHAQLQLRLSDPAPAESEVRFASPFFSLEDAAGARFWNASFGGWRTDDHARRGPSAERFYTDEAIDQFTACVAATGQPLNTMVIALGTNDGYRPVPVFIDNFTAIIDRWAYRMSEHTDDELHVIFIVPYVFSDNLNGSGTPDRVQAAVDHLRAEGTRFVDQENIAYVNLKQALGGEWIERHNPEWVVEPGDVHPSPEGAHQLALLVQQGLGLPPCPADRDRDRFVGPSDLAMLLAGWGRGVNDLTGDGMVTAADLAALLSAWGECP